MEVKLETIIEILSEMHADVDFTIEENLVEDGILDSFDIVSIIVDLRTEFGVVIPPHEIDAVNFNSAKAIKNLLDRVQEYSE